MTKADLLAQIEEAFSKPDSEGIQDITTQYKELYDDFDEIAFLAAVRAGNRAYVENHINEIELNPQDEGTSPYVREASDDVIRALLLMYGAFIDWEEYDCCRLAIETVTPSVLYFSEDFQREVFKKFIDASGLTYAQIITYLESGEDLSRIELPAPLDYFSLKQVKTILKMRAEGGKIALDSYGYYNPENCWEVMQFVESLGWDLDFEGVKGRQYTNGVYFLE